MVSLPAPIGRSTQWQANGEICSSPIQSFPQETWETSSDSLNAYASARSSRISSCENDRSRPIIPEADGSLMRPEGCMLENLHESDYAALLDEMLDDSESESEDSEGEDLEHDSSDSLTVLPPRYFMNGSSRVSYDGMRLIHLLLAGAEAVEASTLDLAWAILRRLKELVSVSGSTIQRVAAYFSEALQCRMHGYQAPGNTETCRGNSLAAFQILHEMSPYIKFAHLTANQAIFEAIEEEKSVHIVDYEIMEGIQWASLMQSLASREGDPPHLRITALYGPHRKRGLAVTQETGLRLTEFAASLKLPFLFCTVRVDHLGDFNPSTVKVTEGEALVANCMVHLPHMPFRTPVSVFSFLHGMQSLSPKMVTFVEEELGFSDLAFSSNHFLESLHHYSAIFDSLELSLSSTTLTQNLVEKLFLAPRILSILTSRSSAQSAKREGELGIRKWCSLVASAGFKPMQLSAKNQCQAKLLLGLFQDGYTLYEEGNRLLLGWHSKPLIAASVWS